MNKPPRIENYRYFVYCRKSTDEDNRQVQSIDSQIAEAKEYALANKLEVVQVFTESKTAKEPGREIFNQMIELLEKGVANAIIAWHPDRLARNSIDGEESYI
jgi:DNA invertase Pin-like site-specific DNA recombinase